MKNLIYIIPILILFTSCQGQSTEIRVQETVANNEPFLIPFRDGKNWGLSDTLGNLKIQPQYDNIHDFFIIYENNEIKNSTYLVEKDGNKFFINYQNKILSSDLDSVEYFENEIFDQRNFFGLQNHYYIIYKDGKQGFFADSAQYISPVYDEIDTERIGLVKKDNKYGVVFNDEVIIPITHENKLFYAQNYGWLRFSNRGLSEEQISKIYHKKSTNIETDVPLPVSPPPHTDPNSKTKKKFIELYDKSYESYLVWESKLDEAKKIYGDDFDSIILKNVNNNTFKSREIHINETYLTDPYYILGYKKDKMYIIIEKAFLSRESNSKDFEVIPDYDSVDFDNLEFYKKRIIKIKDGKYAIGSLWVEFPNKEEGTRGIISIRGSDIYSDAKQHIPIEYLRRKSLESYKLYYNDFDDYYLLIGWPGENYIGDEFNSHIFENSRLGSAVVKVENGKRNFSLYYNIKSEILREDYDTIFASFQYREKEVLFNSPKYQTVILQKNGKQGAYLGGLFLELSIRDSITRKIKEGIIPLIYDELDILVHPYYKAKKDGKYGVIEYEAEDFLPFEYDDIDISSYKDNNGHQDVFILTKNGKNGIYDLKYNITIPIIYENIEPAKYLGFRNPAPDYSKGTFLLFKTTDKKGRVGYVGENNVKYYKN